jgi:hypothetical protein
MTKVGGILGCIISVCGAIFLFIAGLELIFSSWDLTTISLAQFFFRLISICLTYASIVFIALAVWFQIDEPGETFSGGINLVVGFIIIILAFLGSLFNIQLIGSYFILTIPSSGFLLVVSIDGIFVISGGAVGLL